MYQLNGLLPVHFVISKSILFDSTCVKSCFPGSGEVPFSCTWSCICKEVLGKLFRWKKKNFKRCSEMLSVGLADDTLRSLSAQAGPRQPQRVPAWCAAALGAYCWPRSCLSCVYSIPNTEPN